MLEILLGDHLMLCEDVDALSASINGILKCVVIMQLFIWHYAFH